MLKPLICKTYGTINVCAFCKPDVICTDPPYIWRNVFRFLDNINIEETKEYKNRIRLEELSQHLREKEYQEQSLQEKWQQEKQNQFDFKQNNELINLEDQIVISRSEIPKIQNEGKNYLEIEYRIEENGKKVSSQKIKHRMINKTLKLEVIDQYSGVEFEKFLKKLFEKMNYRNVKMTPVTGDQGADLIMESKKGEKIVVQAKRHLAKIGNKAVQEILGAKLHYNCRYGFIVTSSTFTKSAKELSEKDPNIHLFDRLWLEEAVSQFFSSPN